MGVIFNIQRYSLHDGDGIRTTVFFKGCPLRCVWCHNPEGLTPEISVAYNRERCTLCGRCIEECNARSVVDNEVVYDRSKCLKCLKCKDLCPSGANEIFGREATVDEVMAEVLKDKIYYKTSGGGMTLSGGEPSMQQEFALRLIEMAKDAEVSVCIETCGIGKREFYEKAKDLGATFLFDIKCISSTKHKELTGVDNGHIMSNLTYLLDSGADVVIRIPLVPTLNDSHEDISALASFLQENKGKYRYAEIMPYHTFGISKAERLGNDDIYRGNDATAENKAEWKKAFEAFGIDVKIS